MKKILIIDDEEALVNNVKDFLKIKGYEVFATFDGESGMKIVDSEKPDLLILDMSLKEGPSGIDVLRLSKMIDPNLKVVVCTGFGEEENLKNKCTELGIDGFLSKPVSLKVLADTIAGILEVK